HFVWVLRLDAAFEETAAVASMALAARRARVRDRKLALPATGQPVPRPWFALGKSGHPAVAILWKNVASATRRVRTPTLVMAGLSIGVAAAVFPTFVLGSSASMFFASVFAGPLVTRNDFRQDLKHLPLLRSYPLRGSILVCAEIASSALVLTVVQQLVLVV